MVPLWPVFFLLIVFSTTTSAGAGEFEKLKALIGPKDSLVVADPENRIIVSKNKNKKLIPASILKILTSLAALHYLGPDYRYQTEIYLDGDLNLKIKGFGDPLLISEIVEEISRHLATLIGASAVIGDLVVDDSFFDRPLTIPGISSSSQPYDAPNGALCVNFNTVFFKRTKSGYISAEDQTPLLPYAENKIRKLKLKSGRFVLSRVDKENTVYAGKLFEYFLKQQGIKFSGEVKPGRVNEAGDKLLFRYVSRFSVIEIISKLLEYSNNFTTNQLFITTGTKALGPPGNLDKGVATVLEYAAKVLRIENMSIVEGSGISRRNRVSAQHMLRILEKFKPYHQLMRKEDREYYKTGTLFGINTRAGYIVAGDNDLYPYVIMINTAGKSTKPVIRKLKAILW
jgi:D-alanyl-D-alanine carboxypeptidase/D-alanyl-D-alanine-endopeptidase (penicillin-binding protein 4)